MTPTTPDIQTGFQQWISEPTRVRSPEVDFGCWWTVSGNPREFPRWRVSWIEATGELYAVEMAGHRPDRYIALARFEGRHAVEAAMRGWAESELRLSDLLDRFGRMNTRVCTDFASQFGPMPEGKTLRARFAVTETSGDDNGCEWNYTVELLLGPDGNARSGAKIGALSEVPNKPDSDDAEAEEDERGDPPVFVTYRGITVYHCWHGECLSGNWYTTDLGDADIDHGGATQFDVRDLPPALPVGDDGRADHRGRVIAAIDVGLITEGGYINPADPAECDYCGEVTDSTHGHYWPGEGGPGSKWECDSCQAKREAHAEETHA